MKKELIQKLFSKSCWDRQAEVYIEDFISVEKFAQLIVRECVQVCADRGAHHDGLYSAWASDCSDRIGKHFGVEL